MQTPSNLENLLSNQALVAELRAKRLTVSEIKVNHNVVCSDEEWSQFRKAVFPPKSSPINVSVRKGNPSTLLSSSNKKIGSVDWRDLCHHADKSIEIKRKASYSQDELTASIDTEEPIVIIPIADWHAGSYGTTHSQLEEFTDAILSIPNAYVVILGDMIQMAIKMRSVAEVSDNVLHPSLQMDFIESWLAEIGPRVICSCWDNHSVEREEKAVGFSNYSRIMGRNVAFHNGIGHVDLGVGEQVYKMALSHRFRGRSFTNPTHGQSRYARHEGQDREIILAGDSHTPGYSMYRDGDKLRLAINAGTMQTNSSYGKRYFSIKGQPDFPVISLHPKEHRFTPYWSLGDYLEGRE